MKYKNGDKVKVIKCTDCSDTCKCGTGIMKNDHSDVADYFCVLLDEKFCSGSNHCHAKEVELISDKNPEREEVKQMKFKIGDRVKQIISCSGAEAGKEYIVCKPKPSTHLGCETDCVVVGQNLYSNGCHCQDNWELVSPSSQTMTFSRVTLTEKQKKNLTPDAQALVEAGYVSSDLSLRDTDHFTNFLADMFFKEYAAKARAGLDEADKEEKKKKSK